MFEKRLRELSEKLYKKNLKTYYILTHKKHRREIYFQNSKKAMSFIKKKFNSPIKKLVYFLLKIRILQPFLKKIKLSGEFGDVIYVANQIKSFNLENNSVLSFPKNKENEKDFLNIKKFQKKISEKGFAPTIYEINEEIPFSKEILLEERKLDYLTIFRKLMKYYTSKGIEKIPVKNYVLELRKKVKNKHILKELGMLSNKKFPVFLTTLHGDVAKENVLINNKNILFIDWNQYIGPITDDLIGLLIESKLNKNLFNSILKLYPKEIKENLKDYIFLSKISLNINKN